MKLFACLLLSAIASPFPAMAQQLSGDALVKTLQQGGYVIVMRHAASPREVPDKSHANPDNTKPERQLDAEGRASATAFGKALRDLKIPIGQVFSSPTYRALETAKYAQLPNPQQVPELDNYPDAMAIGGIPPQSAWLLNRVAQMPKGTNIVVITHQPNILIAFGQDVQEGEALIFGPNKTLIARVKIDGWPKLVQ